MAGSQNSIITWRQTPQGAQRPETGSPAGPPTIAMASKARRPSRTAWKNAVRSAQFDGVYAAFSMLHPGYTVPSEASSAAPTAKCE